MRYLVRRHSWFAGLLLAVFLSVQLATAAYACMAGTRALEDTSQQLTMAGMEGMGRCPDMASTPDQDARQFNGEKALCMGHCQADTKHADHPAPQVPAFIPVLVNIVVEPPVELPAPLLAMRANAQPRAPPPPHAILHCCFRT
ncbi:copper resistance protein [Cupriavidus consociatus]|uniref:copper resistance protein n=1 Tax=Cupriavidus consociatus TaxID=2821357 RepID=UPI001AE45D13|nr:copper resistance protein [Cupriavidus sp. LEh21]MBP0618384.1 copper resistance protein [Cupriavidus sp. LEh25]MDK2655019.1 copper resistance protein [Cupriavidus sp. LEh21]